MTSTQAAARLGISKRQLNRMVKAGVVPHRRSEIKMGASRDWSEEEVRRAAETLAQRHQGEDLVRLRRWMVRARKQAQGIVEVLGLVLEGIR